MDRKHTSGSNISFLCKLNYSYEMLRAQVQPKVCSLVIRIVACTWRLYNAGYWIDNWIYWITINYTLTTESLTITTDSHN
jgi:hypothetical protein